MEVATGGVGRSSLGWRRVIGTVVFTRLLWNNIDTKTSISIIHI